MTSRHRWRPRRRALAALALGLIAALGVTEAVSLRSSDSVSAAAATALGTLDTQPARAASESAAGVKVAMIELNWRAYEPQPGVFDPYYVTQIQSQVRSLKAAGVRITLGLGLHFTPSWVLSQAGSRFIDQYGNQSAQADLVFNATVRAQATEFLSKAAQAVGMSNIWAIRITSGSQSELVYPSGGHYWAFSAGAQNGTSMPATMARNPFPGWKPGHSGLTPVQVEKWADWYIGALSDVARWQIDTMRRAGFTGYAQIVTPGVGAVPSKYASAIAANLSDGIVGVGAVWAVLYRKLVGERNVTAYVSSLADGSGSNGGCVASDDAISLTSTAAHSWSAPAWISRIARQYGYTVAGENPGYSSGNKAFYLNSSTTGMMATAVSQARSCGFLAVYWAHDVQLWDGTVPFSRLAAYTTASAALPAMAPAL